MLTTKKLKQFNQAYEQDALKAAIYGANPAGVVAMLYEGAIKAVTQANTAIDMQRYDEKSRLISKAMDILDGLRESLDLEPGSEASRNLNDLYIYMKFRLGMASMKNDQAILVEVKGLLEVILPAWQQVSRGMQPLTTP